MIKTGSRLIGLLIFSLNLICLILDPTLHNLKYTVLTTLLVALLFLITEDM